MVTYESLELGTFVGSIFPSVHEEELRGGRYNNCYDQIVNSKYGKSCPARDEAPGKAIDFERMQLKSIFQ